MYIPFKACHITRIPYNPLSPLMTGVWLKYFSPYTSKHLWSYFFNISNQFLRAGSLPNTTMYTSDINPLKGNITECQIWWYWKPSDRLQCPRNLSLNASWIMFLRWNSASSCWKFSLVSSSSCGKTKFFSISS